MKMLMKICLLGTLILYFCGINMITVESKIVKNSDDSYGYHFYTKIECHYNSSNGKKVIISRDYTGDIVVNTVQKFKGDGSLDGNAKARNLTSLMTTVDYNNTTECPVGVKIDDGFLGTGKIFAYDKFNNTGAEYELNLENSKISNDAKDIYGKLPRCYYRSGTVNKDSYGLQFIPNFTRMQTSTGTFVMALNFKVIIEKPTLTETGDYSWKADESIKPAKGKGNTVFETKCPDYAHYNPKGGKHEYVINNSALKPNGWGEHLLLPLYVEPVDYSSQLAKLDEIFKNYEQVDIEVRNELSSCFEGSIINKSTCNTVNLKSNCLTLEKMQTYDNRLKKNHDDTMAAIGNIVLDENNTIKSVEAANNLSLYPEIKAKYETIIKSIGEKFLSTSELFDCAYNKLMSQENLSETEKQAIEQQYQESQEAREYIVKEIKKIEAKLDINTGLLDCDYLLDAEILEWLKTAFLIIQIGAIILVIVLGMLDFSKAVTSAEDGAMKKAWQKFIKRIIALGCLILLPLIIEFILGIVDIPGLTNKNPFCK